jgi:outer membrane protein assembly factor BamB
MKKLAILSIFALAALLSLVPIGFALYPSTTPWSAYRHDAAHTGATLSSAPDTNQTLWRFPASSTSTPLVVDGRVIFHDGSHIYAVDETTGAKLWECPTVYSALTESTYADGRVFFGHANWIYGDGRLICVNVTTGAVIWEQPTNPYLVESSPTVHDGVVYITTTGNYTRAFNATNGQYKWGYETGAPIHTSSPAADEDLLFFGSDDTKLYALNISGPTPISLWNFTANAAIRSSIAVDGGRVIFGTSNRMLYALNETTGALIWSWSLTGPYGMYATVALAQREHPIVYATSGAWYTNTIYALLADVAPGNYTETDFEPRYWTKTLPSFLGSPVFADGKIIIGSDNPDHAVYALDADDGSTLWRWSMDKDLGDAVVADGRVFVCVSGGQGLYCIGEPFPPVTDHYIVNAGETSFDVTVETNSTVSDFNTTALEAEGKISFGVAGINETTGMCNITIPNDMLDGELNVTVDGEQPLYSAAPLNNGTHTSLYFTYNNTIPHAVEITGTTVIPEFPIVTALPMLITTLLATLVQLKRKRNK